MPHHRNTDEVSVLSVWVMTLLTAATGTATAYMVLGPEFGPREMVGFTLGVLASGLLAGQTILRMVRRTLSLRDQARLILGLPPRKGQRVGSGLTGGTVDRSPHLGKLW